MELINTVIGASNILVGVLVFLLSIPLKNGSIRMNNWYGFRIQKSFESDEAWYKINEYGAKRFMWWSQPIILVGILSFLIPIYENMALILLFSLFPLIILISVFEVVHYAKHL